MMHETWSAVDEYLSQTLGATDTVLEHVLAASARAGLPAIQVSPTQGKLLHILARAVGARRILEVGTLGGYSAIWLARALPADGRLITLELDARHAHVARENLAHAGVSERVEVRIGPALDELPKIASAGAGPFDLVFVDADKPRNAEYVTWALRLARVGSLIVVDNVVRDGEVVDAASTDASVQGTRRVLELLAAERRVSATAIQTVGAKGYDGFAVAVVLTTP
ncbi:MAG: O-methyltransferase [Phycisphaerae bacterium]